MSKQTLGVRRLNDRTLELGRVTKQAMKGLRVLGTSITLFLAVQAPANALSLELDFNTLPSTQGWAFVTSAGLSEANIFSVDGTTLTQNTIGTGFGTSTGSFALYQVPDALNLSMSYSFDLTARIIEQEGNGAFGLFATGADRFSAVSFDVSQIFFAQPLGFIASFDNSVFHDYLFLVSATGSFDFFVDGTLLHSGMAATTSLPNLVYFGDTSVVGNGHVEITRLAFHQPAVVPAPTAALLMLSALGVLVSRRNMNIGAGEEG